ncbi:MAG: SapC family protein [Burkholderiaceae bacterium]|nr:SapC family protein [Burkholderiaceae bacterium]
MTEPTAAAPAAPDTPGNAQAGPNVASALYRQVVLVDRQAHARRRVQPVRDWRIAAEMNAVLVTGSEFAAAAREFAIAFVPVGPGGDGKPQVSPVVLLGLRERENLLVTPQGGWDARFLPAFLRRYPFAYVRGTDERFSLAVDAAWPGFGEQEGEPLFDAQGEITAHMAALLKFLDAFEEDAARTRRFCERLVQLDLLRGGEIKGQLADGSAVEATGFYMIDEAKLRALPDETVLELHRSGALALIHAHLVSMGQVEALAARLQQRGH